ncbi:unnamed protein product [Nesidiocoris tenuis]|uniref:RNA-directed DNA polymerase n=1 Tax=Nesidiocoris tenuis TaxID=355587 RepID=A0A6H5G6P3_9HEMI|nr:unnamed protein product [Nesidiocoris tenuis]
MRKGILHPFFLFSIKTGVRARGDSATRTVTLEVRKLRLKIFLPLPRSNTRRTCCCPGHSTRKPRSYRLEARTLHLDPGLLPLEGLRTTLDIVKKKNRDKLSTIPGITHRIATQTEEPIYLRPYRIPHVFKEDVENQLLDMEKQGIIRRSNSAYNFPLIVVRKKPDQNSGKIDIRICIDYRKLNEITIGQTFPIPNIADILDSLGNSRYFTTIDLASAFHQISVDPRDIQKTAFSSGNAHWEYLKMPFGLKSAPATMAKAMSMVLNSHKGIRAFAYLDDVIVHSPDLKRHIEEIRLLFQAMRKFHLRISPQKCAYLRKEVTYLGHHISDKGVLPDESKVAVLKRMPVPRNVKEVKSFVAFASYYRKFVKNFAQIAVPLTRLTKKDVPFRWTSQEQQEATVVQRKLTTIAAEQLVDECASRLMYLINKYRADVESLTDLVLFAKMGFLHPHILTPHQLVDALSEAKNHLRNGTRFPVPINLDQAHNVLKTLRITAYFSEGKLVCLLNIPIVRTANFNYYHVAPLPFWIENNTYGVLPLVFFSLLLRIPFLLHFQSLWNRQVLRGFLHPN